MIVEELDAARALVPEDASLGETARFFALLSIAAADGLIAGFDCKYAYNFWRPYHAIVLAETDGNPATEADPDWLPLLNTPANFQEYVSAHSTISGGYFRMLMNLVGNDNPLTLTVPRLGGISRYYPEISEAMEEVNVSRIYAEFHYRSSVDLGQAVGYQTADYIFENYLIPLKHRDREAEE